MESTKLFRMTRMQIMNMINIGFSKNVPIKHIVTMVDANINAVQLFLTHEQILELREQMELGIYRASCNKEHS